MTTALPPPSLATRLRRYWVLALGLVLVSVAVAAVLGLTGDRRVSASSRLVLTTPSALDTVGVSAVNESTFLRYVKQRALVATSDAILQAVAKDLGNISVSDLRDAVTASAGASGDAVIITARADSADQAVKIANKVTDVYRRVSRERATAAYQRSLAVVAQKRKELVSAIGAEAAKDNRTVTLYDQQALAIQINQAKFGDGVTFADPATGESVTDPPSIWPWLLWGLLVGVLLALGAIWLRARGDRRVRTAEDVVAVLDAPLLGEVRFDEASLNPLDAPHSDFSAAWAALQERVSQGTVLVTGPSAFSGRTATALHLAAAAAHDGYQVLLIDTTQASDLSDAFELADVSVGFHHLVAGKSGLDQATYEVILGEESPGWVIPAGDVVALPPGVRRAEATEQVFSELGSRFDIIFVDTAPGLDSPVTAAVARLSRHVVLVAKFGENADRLGRFQRRLALFGHKADGVVLTRQGRARDSEEPMSVALS